MNFKGNTISMKLFSEITVESCIVVHHPKVYDHYSNLPDYYVINEVNKLVDSGIGAEDATCQIEDRYLLKPIDIAYNKPQFKEKDFTLSLVLYYKGSNDILRIKQEKETEIDKLLTVDIDDEKLTKSIKFRRVPNEVSDDMEKFIVEFRKYVEQANKLSSRINEVRSVLIAKYVEERIAFNKHEEKMKGLLSKG